MNIAVTGGIGSGKSRVAQALAEMLGARCVSADSICRELLEAPNPGYMKLRESIAAKYFRSDGQLNRSLLRKAIFSDALQREKVNAVLHPLVRDELFNLSESAKVGNRDLLAEVPLLFEKCWQSDFDLSLVVFAADEVCVKRIMTRDHVSKKDAREAVGVQMPLTEKCRLADLVIDNSGSFTVTLNLLRTSAGIIAADAHFRGNLEKNVKKC